MFRDTEEAVSESYCFKRRRGERELGHMQNILLSVVSWRDGDANKRPE